MIIDEYEYDIVGVVYFSQLLKLFIFSAPIENLKWFFFK